ncbi:MAG TPA: tripartite tricarboxylate transporter substrate binding protein [Xanthobacteraceae bacterium]|jgi:tripartite-type tricarboxylate transporter receptor subunit TctC
MLLRRFGPAGFFAALLLSLMTAKTTAQPLDYPSRPLRLVVAFTAGGTTDFVARLLADKMKAPLGQSVIVDNRPGANGAIGAEYVARSDPDGYTLFFTTVGAVAINPAFRKNLSYDPIADFAPVGMAVKTSTIVVVRANLEANSATELVALARQRPVTVGVTGIGAISHLGLELFQSVAGVKFQHVPYRGAAQAITDLIGGQLDGLVADVPTVLTNIRAGKIKALGATSQERSDMLPEVPTLVEQGFPNTIADQWGAVLAPAKTPPAIVAKLNAALLAALNDPDMRAKLAQSGVTPAPSSPENFARYLQDEIARWGNLIRDKGIKPES